MAENKEINKYLLLQKNLSSCVNTKKIIYKNKEIITNNFEAKKRLGFIISGKANIIKTDINGNTTIMRELKTNDIFSPLFFQNSEDEIFLESKETTEVIIIDLSPLLKGCQKKCSIHNNLIKSLFKLLIKENKEQNEKIELLSQKTVRDKILYFIKQRMNENKIFKVTTSYKAIAEYIVVDRSNLMRELKKMEVENLIERKEKYIKIKD